MATYDRVPDEETLKKLMRILELTHEQEFSCLETFAVLDQYVEILLLCKQRASWDLLVEQHLDLCEQCRAEFEALIRILQAEMG